jgi:site-specific DNA recombinase
MQFSTLLIALYARLSKDRAGLSENVQIQLREGEEYVEDNGGRVALRFNDDDISASKYSKKPRPDYDRLVAAIERGEVELIVVTEMTRLYRRLEELLDLIKMAERTRLRGIWTTDGIGYDLGTPEGIHAAIAAVNNAMLESAKLSKRTRRKKKARAEAGKNPGGTRAFGYEGALKDDDGNILNRKRINVELVEAEAKVFQWSVERIIAGESATSVMYDLNRQGIRAPQGGQWGIGNFKKCLIKKRYIIFDDDDPERRGTLEYNGQEYRAAWPGLITRQQHALMLARLAESNPRYRPHTRVKSRGYLYTGLVFCSACGGLLFGSARKTSNGDGYQRRYRCRKLDNYGNVIGCGKLFRAADPLEDFVSEAVLDRLDTDEVAKLLEPDQGEDPEVSALVSKLAQSRQHRKNLVTEYGRGEHIKADYRIMLAAADEAIEAAEAALDAELESQTILHLPARERLREAWQNANTEWRATVAKLVIEKIVVLPGRPGSHRYKEWRFNPEHIQIVWREVNMHEVAANLSLLVRPQASVGLAA